MKPYKILVMDDNRMIGILMEQIMSRLGYDLTYTTHGGETLEAYRKAKEKGAPFDIVFLDLVIEGGMGGEETISRLKELDPDIRAVAFSGYFNHPVMKDFGSYGFQASLGKPFTLEDILNAVKTLIPH